MNVLVVSPHPDDETLGGGWNHIKISSRGTQFILVKYNRGGK